MIPTQYTLVELLREDPNRKDAWERFWQIYDEPVVAYASELTDRQRALEVLQETRAWMGTGNVLAQFTRGEGKFYDFLLNVVKDVTARQILRRFQAGTYDEFYWRRFLALFEQQILGQASKHLKSKEDCEDFLCDFLKWLREIGFSKYRQEKGKFESFLFKLVHDRAIDRMRKLGRDPHNRHISIHDPLPGADADITIADTLVDSSYSDPYKAARQKFDSSMVRQALTYVLEHDVEPDTAGMFRMYVLEGVDAAEVAKAFGRNVQVVYQARHSILKKVRKILENADHGMDFEEKLVSRGKQT